MAALSRATGYVECVLTAASVSAVFEMAVRVAMTAEDVCFIRRRRRRKEEEKRIPYLSVLEDLMIISLFCFFLSGRKSYRNVVHLKNSI